MVAGAFWNDLANGVIKIFSTINSRSGDTGNGSGGSGDGGIGDLIGNLFNSDGGGSWGDTIKQTIQESLTVDNLNTVKDLLRTYWGEHSGTGHEEEEEDLRKNLDTLRSALGTEGIAGELAKAIDCIENGDQGSACVQDDTVLDVGVRSLNNSLTTGVSSLNDALTTEPASVESFGFNGKVSPDNNTFCSITLPL